jgi:hypothetical protein
MTTTSHGDQSIPGTPNEAQPHELLTKHLRHRLTVFALGNGARNVNFHTPDGTAPLLIVRTRTGAVLTVTLGGRPSDWHAALDRYENECEEPVDLGLQRFLGIRAAA